MNEVIVPPSSASSLDAPVVFLAGPIQGAAGWQDRAIEILKYRPEKLIIASPRRAHYDILSQTQYEEQVDWESNYLEVAGCYGVILFWCSKEAEHDCGRAYAQTTRAEFGEWVLGKKVERTALPVRVAIGIEDGYTGAKYYRHRMSKEPRLKDVPIFTTLEETVAEALRLLPNPFGEPR